MPTRPCVVCGAHVFIASRAARPRCRPHIYPEKLVRRAQQPAAAAIRRSGRCAGCGAVGVKLQADHPVPLAAGGDPHHLVPLCLPCHQAKTAAERRA
jgi:5-methylcytosine-specific restriction endonuclease McrA